VWITTSTLKSREALMPHRNAPLTETGRLRLARCVVDDGYQVTGETRLIRGDGKACT
jgi:hypothetical protein